MSAFTQNPNTKDQAARLKAVRAVEAGLGGRLAQRLVEDFGWTEQQIEAWQRDRQEGPESIVEIDRHMRQKGSGFWRQWRPSA